MWSLWFEIILFTNTKTFSHINSESQLFVTSDRLYFKKAIWALKYWRIILIVQSEMLGPRSQITIFMCVRLTIYLMPWLAARIFVGTSWSDCSSFLICREIAVCYNLNSSEITGKKKTVIVTLQWILLVYYWFSSKGEEFDSCYVDSVN